MTRDDKDATPQAETSTVMVGEGRPSTTGWGRFRRSEVVDGRPSPAMTVAAPAMTGQAGFALP